MNHRLRKNNALRFFGALIAPMVLCSAEAGAAIIDAFASDGSTTPVADPNPGGVTTHLTVDFGSTNGLWMDMNQASTNPNEQISLKLTNNSGESISQISVQILKPDSEFENKDALNAFQWGSSLQVVDTGMGANNGGFIDGLDGSAQGFFWGIEPLGPGGEITITLDEWIGFGTDNWWLNIDLNEQDITFAGARDNVVVVRNDLPIPGAVWLLGSGLLGLVGISRRRVNG